MKEEEISKTGSLINRLIKDREYYDKGFLETDNLTAVILLDSNYKYIGQIYTWTDENETNTMDVMQIRSSLENIHCEPYVSNIALNLFYGVAQLANHLNIGVIRVIDPYEWMQKILQGKLDFQPEEWDTLTDHLSDVFIRLDGEGKFKLPEVIQLTDEPCEHPFLEEIKLTTGDVLDHDMSFILEFFSKRKSRLPPKDVGEVKEWITDLILREPYRQWDPYWLREYGEFEERRKTSREIMESLKKYYSLPPKIIK